MELPFEIKIQILSEIGKNQGNKKALSFSRSRVPLDLYISKSKLVQYTDLVSYGEIVSAFCGLNFDSEQDMIKVILREKPLCEHINIYFGVNEKEKYLNTFSILDFKHVNSIIIDVPVTLEILEFLKTDVNLDLYLILYKEISFPYSIPSFLKNFKKVALRDCSGVKYMNPVLGKCKSLEIYNLPRKVNLSFVDFKCNYIDMSYSNVENIPLEFQYCTTLKLDATGITSVPKELGNCKYLDLSNNYIEKIPIELSKCHTLILRNIRITDVPIELGNCKILDLSSNSRLYLVPSSLSNCEELNLSGTKLIKVPKELGNCKKLRLSSTNISYVPPELGNCKLLDLSYTGIETIPVELSNCENLFLNSCYNLTTFPKELSHCSLLNVSNTKIKEIPPEWGNCETLFITNTSLQYIPKELGKCRYLDLSHNFYIKTIPKELGCCEYLSLKYCRCITDIPKELGGCRILDLSALKIQSIPTELSNCNILILYSTEIETLNEAFGNCKIIDLRSCDNIKKQLPIQLENCEKLVFFPEDKIRHNFKNGIYTYDFYCRDFNFFIN